MGTLTMFDKYGGFSSVSKIVLDLYERLMDDDDVGPFFDDVEFAKIVDHQTKFVSSLMGGPVAYTDAQIEKTHDHLTITAAHFEKLTRILAETLLDHDVSEEDTQSIVGEFVHRRHLVVRD